MVQKGGTNKLCLSVRICALIEFEGYFDCHRSHARIIIYRKKEDSLAAGRRGGQIDRTGNFAKFDGLEKSRHPGENRGPEGF